MWSPTHVQVLVKRARGLNLKGKNGTNDAFVTIALGKEKYQTSVKEKSVENVEWCEQCELKIPDNGNTAEIVLTVLHRNFLGVDEFLGIIGIPLRDFDVYERPKTKWYTLKCKPGQSKKDYRGELEVRTAFTVKAASQGEADIGSTADLNGKTKDKHKGSLQSLNKVATNFGGSLLSLKTKEKKHLKKFAKAVSHKVDKAKRSLSKTNLSNNNNNHDPALPNKFNFADDFGTGPGSRNHFSRLGEGDRDPGVNSDDEDDMFKFDELSHKSSGSSLNVGHHQQLGIVSKTSAPISGSLENVDIFKQPPSSRGTPTIGNRNIKSATLGRLSQRELIPSSSRATSKPILDEWEAKLLGQKGAVPYQGPQKEDDENNDTISLSQISQSSQNSNPRLNLDKVREKQQQHLQTPSGSSSNFEETPNGRKKIIPVGSDFESSPSPESSPTPISPKPRTTQQQNNLAAPSVAPSSVGGSEHETEEKKKKSGLKKLKSSYRSLVDTGRSGSLFNLSQLGHSSKGLRDKDVVKNSSSPRNSNESIGGSSRHSRTLSDGSGSGHLPPSGTRVVLGRETTPTPTQQQNQQHGPTRVAKEIWDRFEGRSREDLIEMIVHLQASIESQARKQSDLEDYIDSLLMKVMKNAPTLLQKDANGTLIGSNMMTTPSLKGNELLNKDLKDLHAQCNLL